MRTNDPFSKTNDDLSLERSTGYARARVGLIIPSSNRLTEPQFRAYMPADIAVHVTRLQMTGRHSKPVKVLAQDVAGAASALADARCDVIVFHCTGNAMENGPEGERLLLEAIRSRSDAVAISTAQAIIQALRASAVQRLVLVSPYHQSINDHEKDYLAAFGIETIHDVALDAPVSDGFIAVPPHRWREIVHDNARADADGYFLSCTNTTQIDVVPILEEELRKPVVSSNQATIWACLHALSGQLGGMRRVEALGSLAGR